MPDLSAHSVVSGYRNQDIRLIYFADGGINAYHLCLSATLGVELLFSGTLVMTAPFPNDISTPV